MTCNRHTTHISNYNEGHFGTRLSGSIEAAIARNPYGAKKYDYKLSIANWVHFGSRSVHEVHVADVYLSIQSLEDKDPVRV